ncbi:acetylornithine deacetylase [Devosia rhodophyticola]|uniref:Acetylornithine deacetylase n=1 Tax=Devosia rhodophyticola TaxID=3026423 RepID=A0ABY7Z0G5_9HYPH|nr:acetylornithine deacetylase [Devosia rhodophyticola]WDR07091.1 acetylornithine deacetylase [Devosia rhodophyticola]
MVHALLNDAVAVLDDLIGFDSISLQSNLAVIAYLGERLDGLGIHTRLSHSTDGQRANLFATIGPRDTDGGIVLSGHTDVVPVAGQDWTSDPFVARHHDGRVFGRGACDMKGFIACAMAHAAEFSGKSLRRPLHFAFTFDEEVSCLGAQVMLEQLARTGPKPAVCIVGEPTEMRIIEGHKGCCEYATHFTGSPGHASQPALGVNAVHYAVRYITRLLEIGEALKARAPKNSRFDPAWSTIQVGRIEGGMARNVIAGSCSLDWEMRPVSAADLAFAKANIEEYARSTLLPAMQADNANADIITEIIGEIIGLEPMDDCEAEALVRTLTGDNLPAQCVSFGTEAGLFQQLGIATVICGPGSIEQAHKADEFVELSQLDACLAMMSQLGRHMAD